MTVEPLKTSSTEPNIVAVQFINDDYNFFGVEI